MQAQARGETNPDGSLLRVIQMFTGSGVTLASIKKNQALTPGVDIDPIKVAMTLEQMEKNTRSWQNNQIRLGVCLMHVFYVMF